MKNLSVLFAMQMCDIFLYPPNIFQEKLILIKIFRIFCIFGVSYSRVGLTDYNEIQ